MFMKVFFCLFKARMALIVSNTINPTQKSYFGESTLIDQQSNIYLTIESKYTPISYLYQNQSYPNQNKQIIFTMQNDKINSQLTSYIFLYYLAIDSSTKTLKHCFEIVTQNTKYYYDYQVSNTNYEGFWFTLEIRNDAINQSLNLTFYQNNNNKLLLYQKILLGETLLIQNDFSFYLGDSKISRAMSTNLFQGPIKYQLIAFATKFSPQTQSSCSSNSGLALRSNASFTPTSYYEYTTADQISKSYGMTTWLKVTQNQELSKNFINVFHIQQSPNLMYLNQVGGKLLQICYSINSTKQIVEIIYQSYKFPFLPQIQNYIDPLENKIIQEVPLTISLYQWHYFSISFRNNQIVLNLNFVQQNQVVAKTISNVYQFSDLSLVLHFGGTLLNFSNANGIFVNPYFYNCLTTFTPKCHFSCSTCFGPYSNQCITCSTSSKRYLSDNSTCICKIGSLEVNITSCYSISSSTLVEQYIPLSNKQGYDQEYPEIVCAYGYFKYDDECYAWYKFKNIVSPKLNKVYFCPECIQYPNTWVFYPKCTKNYGQYGQNINNTFTQDIIFTYAFQILVIDPYDIYLFSDNKLQFCEYCSSLCLSPPYDSLCASSEYYHLQQPVMVSCVQNGQLFNGKCQLCPQGCDKCVYQFNQFVCQIQSIQQIYHQYCYPQTSMTCSNCLNNEQYFMNLDLTDCLICQIPNCKYCFQYILSNPYYNSVFNAGKTPYDKEDLVVGCALCQIGFIFNFLSGQCEINTNILGQSCSNYYISQGNNAICLSSSQISVGVEIIECQNYLARCKRCLTPVLNQYYCLECEYGFYINKVYGTCVSCQDYNSLYLDCAQEESLRDITFLYGLAPQIYSLTNQYPGSQSVLNLIVKVKQCISGYNSQSTTLCVTTDSQFCSNYDYGCRHCESTQEGTKRLTILNLRCSNCPYYCEYCKPRLTTELNQINPYLNLTIITQTLIYRCIQKSSLHENIFLDNKQQVSRLCTAEFPKCQLKFSMQLTSFPSLLSSISNIVTNQNLYYNLRSVNIFYLYLNISNKFLYQNTFYNYYYLLKNNLITQIISLHTTKLILSFDKITNGLIFGKLKFQDFQEIEIIQASILFSITTQSGLVFESKGKIKFKLENVIIQDTDEIFLSFPSKFDQVNTSRQYQIAIQNPSLVNFTNLIVQNISIINQKFINLTTVDKDFTYLEQLYLYNVTFFNCSFIQASVFHLIEENQYKTITIQMLKFIKCSFFSSEFFGNENLNVDGSFIIKGLEIQSCQFYDSDFILLPLYTTIIIKQLNIQNSQFKNSSFIKTSSSLSVINATIENNILINFNLLKKIKSETKILDEIYEVREFIIKNNVYQNLIIVQIQQYAFEKISINLQDLIQNNLTSLDSNIDKDQYFYNFQAETVQISKINFTRLPGSKDFSIIDSSSVQIINITVLSSIIEKNYDYTNLENHTLNQLFYIDSQNTIIKNLRFYNQIGVDVVFIQVLGTKNSNSLSSIQIEQLDVQNLQLIKISFSQICTFIYSLSSINQQVQISKSSFLNVLLNEFIQDTKVSSAALAVFISDLGQVNLTNIQLNKISVLNSTNSIFLIQSLELIIQDLQALNINTYYYNYVSNLFIFDINQYVNQVQVNSLGGLFNTQTKQITVLNSIYQNIIALQGGVFYITTKQNGQVYFSNNIFQNITTSPVNTLEGKGGCLFVNSENSYLNFSFNENLIENSTSGQQAGAIYIKPSQYQSKIKVQYLKMKNVFSLKNSIIFLSFADLNFGTISHVLLKNIIIENNIKEFEEYYDRFKLKLNENQISQYNAMLYFADYLIQINNFTFIGFTNQPIFYIKFARILAIHKLSFQNITHVSNYLIFIENSQTINSSLIIQDFIIRNSSQLLVNSSQNLVLRQNLEEYQLILNTSYYLKSLFQLQINKNLTSAHLNFMRFIENICLSCNTGILNLQFYSSEKSLRMSNLQFLHNFCGIDSCLSIECQVDTSIYNQLSKSKFINNSANYYGALKMQNSNIEITSSIFLQNTALVKGGAVFYNNIQNKLLKAQTYFLQNKAQIGGAIYDQNLYQKSDTRSYFFLQNLAKFYGNNLATQPIQLQMLINENPIIQIDDQLLNETISEVHYTSNRKFQQFIYLPSGTSLTNYQKFDWNTYQFKKYQLSLTLKPKNLLGEDMIIDDSSYCFSNSSILMVNQPSTSYLIQTSEYDSQRNEFSLNDFIYILDPQLNPNSSIQADISCNNIQNYQLRFFAKTLKCQIGEYYLNSQCIKCDNDQGFYSVIKNSVQCKRIDIQMIKSTTGAMIELQPGYWRPHIRSDLIEKCSKYQSRCFGGWNVADEICNLGAIGALCEQCDIYNIRGDGSFLNSKNQNCSFCGNTFIQLLLVLSQSLWIILTINLTVNSNNYSNQQLFKLKCLYRHFEAVYKNMMDQTSTLIKLANNHLQVLSLIETFQISTIWNLWNIVLFLGDSNYMISYQIDCSLPQITVIDYEYAHYLLISIFPIFHFSMYCILFVILMMAKKLNYSKSYIYSSIIYLYCLNQQNLIKWGVSLISKRTISGIDWIQANVASRYNTEKHQIWSIKFTYPMLFFIGILIPLFLFFQLRTIKSKLDDRVSRLKYSFLYNEYNPKSYYWEILKMLQKISIILIANYYEQLILIKGLLIFLIVLLYYYICQHIQPYKLHSISAIDIKTSFVLSLTIAFSLLLYVIQTENLVYLDYLIQFIIYVLIMTLLEAIVHRIILAYITKLNIQLDFLRKLIVRRFPSLNQQIQCLKPYLELRFNQQQRVQQRFQKIKKYLLIQSKFIKENNMIISQTLKESNSLGINIFSANISKRQLNTERGTSVKMLE